MTFSLKKCGAKQFNLNFSPKKLVLTSFLRIYTKAGMVHLAYDD